MIPPLRSPATPTSELYGLAGNFRRVSVPRASMGESFRVGQSIVVVRCAPKPEGCGSYVALIDDDVEAIIADEKMPTDYRKRLHSAWQKSALRLHPQAAVALVVPSEQLEAHYREKGHQVIRLDPAWKVPELCPELPPRSGRLRVGFLGTRSHLPDLELLRPTLEDASRDWEFHHFLGSHAPAWLQRLPHVCTRAAGSWPQYKRLIGQQRMEVCVYPLLPTRVNQARSCNKLMEHAMTGCAALYSDSVPFRGKMGDLAESVLVRDDQWPDAIRRILNDPDARREMALKTHHLGHRLAAMARQRQQEVWSALAAGTASG
jgi:hypothetical protein